MFGLSRSFWDCRWRSFRAVRGMPLRGTPLHSASDRGSTDSMAYGDYENLKSFASILSTNGATRLRLLTVRFSQKPITCVPNICHKHKSQFQRVLVNSVPPHFMSGIVVSAIPCIGTIVKVDDSENPFLILKHSYIQLQVQSMKFNGQEFLPL